MPAPCLHTEPLQQAPNINPATHALLLPSPAGQADISIGRRRRGTRELESHSSSDAGSSFQAPPFHSFHLASPRFADIKLGRSGDRIRLKWRGCEKGAGRCPVQPGPPSDPSAGPSQSQSAQSEGAASRIGGMPGKGGCRTSRGSPPADLGATVRRGTHTRPGEECRSAAGARDAKKMARPINPSGGAGKKGGGWARSGWAARRCSHHHTLAAFPPPLKGPRPPRHAGVASSRISTVRGLSHTPCALDWIPPI